MMKLIIKIVFLLCLIYASKSKDITVNMQKYLSFCNKNYCNSSTKCRPINRTSKLISLDIYLHPGVKLEAPIDFEMIAYKKFTTVYRQHMFKIKEEMCELLSLKNHPIFRLYNDSGMTFSGNMFDPCPFSGHRYMLPTITQPNLHMIPLVPVGEWKIEYIISKNINKSKVNIVSVAEYYEIKPTGAKEF